MRPTTRSRWQRPPDDSLPPLEAFEVLHREHPDYGAAASYLHHLVWRSRLAQEGQAVHGIPVDPRRAQPPHERDHIITWSSSTPEKIVVLRRRRNPPLLPTRVTEWPALTSSSDSRSTSLPSTTIRMSFTRRRSLRRLHGGRVPVRGRPTPSHRSRSRPQRSPAPLRTRTPPGTACAALPSRTSRTVSSPRNRRQRRRIWGVSPPRHDCSRIR